MVVAGPAPRDTSLTSELGGFADLNVNPKPWAALRAPPPPRPPTPPGVKRIMNTHVTQWNKQGGLNIFNAVGGMP